jgi:hypothetical protein
MADRSSPDSCRVPTLLIVMTTVVSLLTAGCVSLANTPAQDLAWSRWTACRAQVAGTDLKTIQLDGRIVFWYSGPGDGQAMLACLRSAVSGGDNLPEPLSELRQGGGGGGGGGGGM